MRYQIYQRNVLELLLHLLMTELSRNFSHRKKLKIPQKQYCPVTKLPAKYFDPITQTPYATTEAFRLIREAYAQQQADRKRK